MGNLIDYEDEDQRVFSGSWHHYNNKIGLQNTPARQQLTTDISI